MSHHKSTVFVVLAVAVVLSAFADAKAGRFFRRRCRSIDVYTTDVAERPSVDKLPKGWVFTEITDAAYRFGESRILAWSIVEDVRPLRVENCLVGNIAVDGDGKRSWRIFALYRHPNSKNAEWHVSLIHVSYPKGHELWPGFWHMAMELFPKQPTDGELLAVLNRQTIDWSFIVKTNTSSLTSDEGWRPDKRHLVDSHVNTKNWRWFTGQPPSERFLEVP